MQCGVPREIKLLLSRPYRTSVLENSISMPDFVQGAHDSIARILRQLYVSLFVTFPFPFARLSFDSAVSRAWNYILYRCRNARQAKLISTHAYKSEYCASWTAVMSQRNFGKYVNQCHAVFVAERLTRITIGPAWKIEQPSGEINANLNVLRDRGIREIRIQMATAVASTIRRA